MADDSLAGRVGPCSVLADDDTEGCLCLVAGYAKQDGLIARVTAEAQRRVLMSPALGDVLQLRYVDLGPQPGQAGDRTRPVRRIVASLMTTKETAGRSHFALIVIAKSAVTIEGLLGSCAAEPFLAGLRMWYGGIASRDDREDGSAFADITSSPLGSWRDERELIDALRQRCEELPRYFAARGEPGLTRAGLAALQQAQAKPAADDKSREGDADAISAGASLTDVLEEAPGPAETNPGPDTAPAGTVVSAAGRPAAGQSAVGRLGAIGASRWLPGVPWRHGKQAAKTGDPGAAAPAGPARTTLGLVYLLMVVDQDVAADPALVRLQAALLEVDRRLATSPARGYQVRVIHGSDGDLYGELLDAGKLRRAAARRSVKTGDFSAVLKSIRVSLRRDRELVQAIATAAGLTVAQPTVVIFSANPPMADVGGAAGFAGLAADAMVMWVVPGKLEGLVSGAFSTACGVAVLGEHPAVADEILDAVHSGTLAARA